MTTTYPQSGLTPELIEKARIELGEDPEKVPEQLQALRQCILQDPKFNSRTDDAFLLRFLRARKFDHKKSLELLKNYYKQRHHYSDFISKLSAKEVPEALASNYQGALLGQDKDGRRILIVVVGNWNPSTMTAELRNANLLLTLECLIESPDVQINGIVVLVDASGLMWNEIWHTTPSYMKQILALSNNAFPIRYKAIHFVNENFLFNVGFSVIKPFLGKKMRDRVVLHGHDLESLHEYIDPDVLPEEFGGNLGPYSNSDWNRVLEEHDEVIFRNRQYGYLKNT